MIKIEQIYLILGFWQRMFTSMEQKVIFFLLHFKLEQFCCNFCPQCVSLPVYIKLYDDPGQTSGEIKAATAAAAAAFVGK